MKSRPLPRLAPLPSAGPLTKFVRELDDYEDATPAEELPAMPELPRLGKLKLAPLRVAIKKESRITATRELTDPREEFCRTFNEQNRYRGIHAQPLLEGETSNVYDVEVRGKILLRTRDKTKAKKLWQRLQGDPANAGKMVWRKVKDGEESPPTLQEVFNEFSGRLRVPLVIAGGAVRDFHLGIPPKDYDLFAFAPFDRDLLSCYEESNRPLHGYQAFHVTGLRWRGVEVQVIGPTVHKRLEDLLASFDWNVANFAYDGKTFHGGMDPEQIVGGTLRLLRLSNAFSSLRRGFSFAERYGMTMLPRDLEALCRATAEWAASATRAA